MYASVTFLEATSPAKLPTRHCLLAGFLCGQRFRVNDSKERYSTVPPDKIGGSLLFSTVKNVFSMPSYSKAPRGLFVQVQVGRIFTAISISPGNGSRQSLTRSAFRAGRNLPDKEFRYHRTVIVTAAVHTGLSPKLIPICIGFHPRLLTYVHWAGVSPYTLPFGFAETCVLVKQSVSVICCGPDKSGQGISHRLRPAVLPSSLNRFLPFALVYSTSPPVSVCGTETLRFPSESEGL